MTEPVKEDDGIEDVVEVETFSIMRMMGTKGEGEEALPVNYVCLLLKIDEKNYSVSLRNRDSVNNFIGMLAMARDTTWPLVMRGKRLEA